MPSPTYDTNSKIINSFYVVNAYVLKKRIRALKYLNAIAKAYNCENVISIRTPKRCQQQSMPAKENLFKKIGRDKEELTSP